MCSPRCAVKLTFLFVLVVSVFSPLSEVYAETVILKFVLNGEDAGEFFLILAPDGDLWIKREDLEKTRLKEGIGTDVEYLGEHYVSLRSIEGLSYSIIEGEASVEVNAPSGLFREQVVDVAYERPHKVRQTEGNSAFFNYGILYNFQGSALNLSTELGVRYAGFFGSSTFGYDRTDAEEEFVRLLTYIRRDSPEAMRTIVVGDAASASGVLGSGLLIGGVSVARNFSVAPYFIKYPSLSLAGTVEAPSEVELYVNDQLVKKERIYPGSFELSNVSAHIGSGEARIVVTDIYGRKTVITKPFFYSDKLLRRGLHEYSYSAGFRRERLGEESFSYGEPAFIALHNYGITEKIKGGYSFEGSTNLVNVSPAFSFLIARGIAVDTAAAYSNSGGKNGYGAFLGYSYPGPNFNASLSLKSLSEQYSNLALSPSDDKAVFELFVSAGRSFKVLGSLAGGYAFQKNHIGGERNRYNLSYTRGISKKASFLLTASRLEDEAGEAVNEVFFGLHASLGREVSGNLNYARSGDGGGTVGAGIQKNLPSGGRLGYRADVRESGEDYDLMGAMQYQHNYGVHGLEYRRVGGVDNYTVQTAGGIGYMDGTFFLSRPITDSFAKIRVGKLKGVRVYYFGNESGRTNDKGEIIIPNLHSFHDNRIGIEGKDIPIDYVVRSLTSYVSPPYRGGSIIEFDITKVQAFSGLLYVIEEDKKTPAEFALLKVSVKGETIEGLVGRGGEFYIENLPPGAHKALVLYDTKKCLFDIIIPASEEIWVDMGEVVCGK